MPRSGRITLTPNPLEFAPDADELRFRVQNSGNGTLYIDDIEVVGEGFSVEPLWRPRIEVPVGLSVELSLWRRGLEPMTRSSAKLRFKTQCAINAPGGVFEVNVVAPRLVGP